MSFFACYLLTPVNAPKRMRCTYVGFTVSPTRRIRQHNGEIANGAWRTSKYRPWFEKLFFCNDILLIKLLKKILREMVAIVYGFPSKFHALQCKWAVSRLVFK
jgi:structure-specific endonuclease subunit SLX1